MFVMTGANVQSTSSRCRGPPRNVLCSKPDESSPHRQNLFLENPSKYYRHRRRISNLSYTCLTCQSCPPWFHNPIIFVLLEHTLLESNLSFTGVKGKGKAHPLQAMQAQRGLGELRLLDFLISALYGGRLSALRTGRLYPQGHPWYSFSREAESTPGPWFSQIYRRNHWYIFGVVVNSVKSGVNVTYAKNYNPTLQRTHFVYIS
jgi:hypothetical protein